MFTVLVKILGRGKLSILSTGAKPVLGPNCMIPYIKGSKSYLDKNTTRSLQMSKKSKSMCHMYNLQVS